MADKPPEVIEIRGSDVIGVNVIEPGTGRLGIEGSSPIVGLTEAQRSLLERVLKKVLAALPALPYAVEAVVELAPDGTWRVLLRLRR